MTDLAVRPAPKLNRKERKRQRAAATYAAEHAPTGYRGNPLRDLVASAAEVRVNTNYQVVRWGGTEWQQEAWLHYDTCPEFFAGVNIGANNVSRARLIGVEVDKATGEPSTQPTDNPDVQDIMAQLFGGPSGQGQALAAMYRHLDVAGDCWVLGSANVDRDGASWEILATTEVTSGGGQRVMLETLDGVPRQLDPDNEVLMRVWQPHPRRRWEASSAARALLPVLRELAALTAMVSATVKSRLASAGILWLPEEIQLPKTQQQANDVTQVKSESAGASGWLDLITEAMVAPIQDPDSASAVVPLVATVKGEFISKISHMEFGRDLDAMIEPLRESGVKRLAVGMNLPPSVLLGLETANHWTAWAITEDYARAYLAPKLETISDAVTNFYLRPALRARGIDPMLYAVYFDLDKLVPHQVATEQAQAAFDAGLLSEAAYMEALGFSKSQMADTAERARRMVEHLVRTGNPITLTELASTIGLLFPGVNVQTPTAAVPPGGPGAVAGTITRPDAPADPASVATARQALNAPPKATPPPTGTPSGAAGR